MRLLLTLFLACVALACSPREEDGRALRVAYFARLTHAPALTGIQSGRFRQALPGVELSAHGFEFGNAAMEAMFAREIDIAYLGPNPAINGYLRSGGGIRLIAGAAHGGSAFVVRGAAGIASASDLGGKRIASPQIASTQDIALRRYLRKHGLGTTLDGGTVNVLPLATPFILSLFAQGEIDGAWVSEPVASQLLAMSGATVLVDEKDEWPEGQYTATVIVVRRAYLEAHPDNVRRFVGAHRREVDWINAQGQPALELSLVAMKQLAGRAVPSDIAAAAWGRIRVSADPLPQTIPRLAQDARAARFLPAGDLSGLAVTP